jgi:hypothetical protein
LDSAFSFQGGAFQELLDRKIPVHIVAIALAAAVVVLAAGFGWRLLS